MTTESDERVKAVEDAIATGGHKWQAANHLVASLDDKERRRRLGFKPGPHDLSLQAREIQSATRARPAAAFAAAAPSSFDLRNVSGVDYVTPIRDQGGCGSCVAFGTIATVETTARFVRQDASLAIDLSEAQLFYCFARQQGRLCEDEPVGAGNGGWWPSGALDAFQSSGVADESCYPYTAGDQNCTNLCSDWQQRATKITSYQQLNDTASMKQWIATNGALAACFTVYDDFYAYGSGIYTKTQSAKVVGGHCVCVVGFDDAAQCWICKNSWGPDWGEGGFFRIAYGQCGIDATMWGVSGVNSPSPGGTYVPLYRYWNPSGGDHFYTTNWGELGGGAHGWGYEGVQCYVSPDPRPGLVPLYRYWNGGACDHFYTTNWAELGAGAHGWAYEGVQCYVSPGQASGTIPLYRYWNPGIADHFYTTNWNELGSGAHGWGYEGIQCYVWPGQGTAGLPVPPSFRTSATLGSPPSTMPSSFMTPVPSGGSMVPATFRSGAHQRPSSFKNEAVPPKPCRCGSD
jgi:C1A family cysteine protease